MWSTVTDYLKKLKGLWHTDNGQIALEATIVVPVFLSFMVALINLINVTAIYLSMDYAVSETVKIIAARTYPLKYLDKPLNSADAESGFSDLIGRMEVLERSLLALNENGEGNTLETQLLGEMGKAVKEKVSQALLEQIAMSFARDKITQLYPLPNIDDLDFEVTYLKMYNPYGGGVTVNDVSLTPEDVMLTVQYKVKPAVPFIKFRDIVLTNTAVERAWADD